MEQESRGDEVAHECLSLRDAGRPGAALLTRTWSGGMRHNDRKPSWLSTGTGGSGGHSAARCTASVCTRR